MLPSPSCSSGTGSRSSAMPGACPRHPRCADSGRSRRIAVERSMITGNLFANVAHELPHEQIVELLSAPNVRIERIVSTGHTSALDGWYDQERPEWVLLLA